jgi:hypothetical protein
MKVAILGAGMSGLLAAKACMDNKVEDFTIFDKNPKQAAEGRFAGLHYLHDNCGLPLRREFVRNMVLGFTDRLTPSEAYAFKLHLPDGPNSVDKLQAVNVIYNPAKAHELLWEWLGHHVVEYSVSGATINDLRRKKFDLTLSTVPLVCLYPEARCYDRTAWVMPGRPQYADLAVINQEDLALPILAETQDHLVVYNVNPSVKWARYSKVFGREWTEYTTQLEGAKELFKVVTTDFKQPDTDRAKVKLIGRWGKWQRGYLMHQAYYETCGLLRERSI